MEYITLADYDSHPNPLVAGVAKTMRATSPFIDILPFKTISAKRVETARDTAGLPESNWREFGTEHGSTKADKPELVNERIYSIGDVIAIDKTDMRDQSKKLYDPRVYQTEKRTKCITRKFVTSAILGTPEDEMNPVGLMYRVNNFAAAENRLNANALDITATAAGLAANATTLFEKLDEMLYRLCDSLDNTKGVYLLTNDTVILRYNSLARQFGNLKTTEDALGRTFSQYKGATFVDMGKKNDDVTRILGNAELTDGSALTGGTCSSIIGMRIGDELVTGIQEYDLEVSPFEVAPGSVLYQSVIDWAVGIAVTDPRHSLARLSGLKAA